MRNEDLRDGRCLRLRGLPFGVTEAQVAAFLAPCATVERIVLCVRDGKCTGHAFVVCATAAQAAHAFSALNKQRLGHRYIEVFNALPREVDAAAAGNSDYEGATDGRSSSSSSSAPRPHGAVPALGATAAAAALRSSAAGQPQQRPLPLQHQQQDRPVVRIRGVPRGVPPAAMAEWLLPARCWRGGSRGIHYDLDECGFFMGTALVELMDTASLEAALAKNGQVLANSALAIEPSDQATLQAHLAIPADLAAIGSAGGSGSGEGTIEGGGLQQQVLQATTPTAQPPPPPPRRPGDMRQFSLQPLSPPPQQPQPQQRATHVMLGAGYAPQAGPQALVLPPACTQYDGLSAQYVLSPTAAAAAPPPLQAGLTAPSAGLAFAANPGLGPAASWPQPLLPQVRPPFPAQPPQAQQPQQMEPGGLWQQQLYYQQQQHQLLQQQQQRRYTMAEGSGGAAAPEATFEPGQPPRRQTQ